MKPAKLKLVEPNDRGMTERIAEIKEIIEGTKSGGLDIALFGLYFHGHADAREEEYLRGYNDGLNENWNPPV